MPNNYKNKYFQLKFKENRKEKDKIYKSIYVIKLEANAIKNYLISIQTLKLPIWHQITQICNKYHAIIIN